MKGQANPQGESYGKEKKMPISHERKKILRKYFREERNKRENKKKKS